MSKEKTGRKGLVELLETDYEEKDEAVLLLEKAFSLKKEKDRIEGEYDEIKEDLAAHQKLSGLEGLRHNRIAFVVSHREGRETTDPKLLAEALVSEGVKPDVIKKCFAAAVKQGQGYYVREIVDLAPKEKKEGKSVKDDGKGWS